MDDTTYRSELEKLDTIVSSIAQQSATVDLSDYNAFCELAKAPCDTIAERIKRCDALIQAMFTMIGGGSSVCFRIFDIPCSNLQGFAPTVVRSFEGMKKLGREFVVAAGNLLRLEAIEIITDRTFSSSDIIRIADGCSKIGDSLNAHRIITALCNLAPRELRARMAAIDMLSDPDISTALFTGAEGSPTVHWHDASFLDDLYGYEPKLSKANPIEDFKAETDENILCAFVKSLDIKSSSFKNDSRLLALVARKILQVIPLLNSQRDFAQLLVRIPQELLKCSSPSFALLEDITRQAIGQLCPAGAIAVTILLNDHKNALWLLRDNPHSYLELPDKFREMAEVNPIPKSRMLTPAFRNFPEQCIRYANIASLPACPIDELSILHVTPENVYNDPKSKLMQILLDLGQVDSFALIDIEWWKYRSDIVVRLLSYWQSAITNGNTPVTTKQTLVQQLERCPLYAMIFNECDGVLCANVDIMSYQFRINMALAAVERGDAQYACKMLQGWSVSAYSEQIRDEFGSYPENWDELFIKAKKIGKSGADVLRMMAKALPIQSYENREIKNNAYAINAIACAITSDYLEAYRIVQDGITKLWPIKSYQIPLLYLLGYFYAYNAGLLTDALRLADQMATVSGSKNSDFEYSGLNMLLASDDISMITLLIAKLSGLDDEAVLEQHCAISKLVDSFSDSSLTLSAESQNGQHDSAVLADRVVMHYPGYDYMERFSSRYIGSSGLEKLRRFQVQDGQDLFKIRMRMAIASMVIDMAARDNAYTKMQLWLFKATNEQLHKQHGELLIQKQKEADDARIAERDQVISDLSHHIKNLVAQVLDPLQNLKIQAEDARVRTTIDQAFRGGALIREIVQAMNLSYRGNAEDYKQDATLSSENAVSFEQLLTQAMLSALSNMFDGKYFKRFVNAFFPNKAEFLEAKQAFDTLHGNPDATVRDIAVFTVTFMFDMELDIEAMRGLYFRDEHGTRVKMVIVLNELILNAVKNTAEVDRTIRCISLSFNRNGGKCTLQIQNPYKPRKIAATTGLGHVILQNFAQIMGGTCKTDENDGVYNVQFDFVDLWEGLK